MDYCKALPAKCQNRKVRFHRADSRFAPSQWAMALLCNDVPHWLGASLESALISYLVCWTLRIIMMSSLSSLMALEDVTSDDDIGVTICHSWWRHQMETFSALLAICVGNSPVTGEFPAQRPVTRSFDAFFDLRLNKRLSKQLWG